MWLQFDLSLPSGAAVRVASALKAAVMRRWADHDPAGAPWWVSGHDTPTGRAYQLARFLVLPAVGQAHADGRLAGACVWIPDGAGAEDKELAAALVRTLGGFHVAGLGDVATAETDPRSRRRRWAATPARWAGPAPPVGDGVPRCERIATASRAAPMSTAGARRPTCPTSKNSRWRSRGARSLAAASSCGHISWLAPSTVRPAVSRTSGSRSPSGSWAPSPSAGDAAMGSACARPTRNSLGANRDGRRGVSVVRRVLRGALGRRPRGVPVAEPLAARAAEGHWPDAVAVPTGCGKTTCVEIAVWALAAQADRARTDRTAPTRLWWVVNRRALVDDTYTHAARIAKRLDRSDAAEPVAQVAARLRLLAGDVSGADTTPALEVLRLRAGHARNRPRNLAAPAVICATVPMFGSRLLFRGHGAGRYTWPIDAALAGVDSLVILDEAHISAPLVSLIEQLRDLPPPRDRLLPAPRHRPLLVPVSATADTRNAADIVALGQRRPGQPADRPAARGCQAAPRPRDPQALVDAVCAEINAAEGTFTKALVYLNTPADARAGRGASARHARRRRGHRRDGSPARRRSRRGRRRDQAASRRRCRAVDADGGRSHPNPRGGRRPRRRSAGHPELRRGGARAAPRATQPARPQPPRTRPGDSPTQASAEGLYPDTRQILDRLRGAADDSGVAHAGPAQIRDLLEDLLEPPDRDDESPVLSESLLWEWVKTTNPPRGEAPVEAFYAGFRPAVSTADVLWRAHIPEPGEALWPPVSPDEIVEVSLSDARQLVNNNPEHIALLADDARTVEAASVDGIRAGCVLIAHTSVGSLDADGHWDPDAAEPVPDMAVISWGLPLTRAALGAILGGVTPTAERARGRARRGRRRRNRPGRPPRSPRK